MRVGAADPKRTYTSPACAPVLLPIGQLRVHVKGTAREINLRIRCRKVQRWREFLMSQSQNRLNQPRDAGGSVQMADAAFHRSNCAEVPGVGASSKRFGQSFDLDRIPQWRS